MKTRLAFGGDPVAKDKLISRMQYHMEHDNLVKGLYAGMNRYGDGQVLFRGCAVSCIAQETKYDNPDSVIQEYLDGKQTSTVIHLEVDRLLNIPGIGPLIDEIHESTPLEDSFSLNLLQLLRVDVDYQFLVVNILKYLNTRSTAMSITLIPEFDDSDPLFLKYTNYKYLLNRLLKFVHRDLRAKKFLRAVQRYNEIYQIKEDVNVQEI